MAARIVQNRKAGNMRGAREFNMECTKSIEPRPDLTGSCEEC
jgi:hypothetical protein